MSHTIIVNMTSVGGTKESCNIKGGAVGTKTIVVLGLGLKEHYLHTPVLQGGLLWPGTSPFGDSLRDWVLAREASAAGDRNGLNQT